MTEAEALDMAARAAGWRDWKEAHERTWELDGMRAHAKAIMGLAKLMASGKMAAAAMREAIAELRTRADRIAALKAENERLREAVGILEDGLQEVGDDYPGSSCQEWCQHQIKQARAALKEIEGD